MYYDSEENDNGLNLMALLCSLGTVHSNYSSAEVLTILYTNPHVEITQPN